MDEVRALETLYVVAVAGALCLLAPTAGDAYSTVTKAKAAKITEP